MIRDKTIYDAIIVGSGAAGSFAAKELTEAGMNVLLMEAGDLIDPEKDFQVPANQPAIASTRDRLKAALQGQHIQARCTSFSPMTRHLFVNDRLNRYSTPKNKPFLWYRTRKLGGRLSLWGRCIVRWSDLYFKAADQDGVGMNWPIRYSDLEPFYTRVEEFLGVYGSKDEISHVPDSLYQGPRELTSAEHEFIRRFKKKWPERAIFPARIIANNPARIPLPILAALKTQRLTIQPNAVVKSIELNPQSGLATAAKYVDTRTRKELRVQGRVIVLCASPIESVRILLNSSCSRHPAGIGNSNGILGRFIMDHCPLLFFGSMESNQNRRTEIDSGSDPWDFANQSGFYVPRFVNITEKHSDFYRGYAIHGGIDRSPDFWWMIVFGQMIPRAENRITIRSKRDAWGIPIAHIECERSANDLAMAQAARSTVEELLSDNGLRQLEESRDFQKWKKSKYIQSFVYRWLLKKVYYEPNALILGSGIHELGGARMGDDPSTSVLNPLNQCWDAPNIFVTDASCFPSSGEHHTLTTMAITVRACQYIVSEYKANGLQGKP